MSRKDDQDVADNGAEFGTGSSAQDPALLKTVQPFVSWSTRWSIYRVLALRLRDGSSLADVVASLGREPPNAEIPREAALFQQFVERLTEKLETAQDDEEGPLLATALDVFGKGSLQYFECLLLDVPAKTLAGIDTEARSRRISEILASASDLVRPASAR